MDANELRAMQAPIKERYKADPGAALITLKAKGTLDDSNIACKVDTGRALALTTDGNHQITYADGGFNVTKATITVTVTGTQTFGGSPSFSYTQNPSTPVVGGTLSGCGTDATSSGNWTRSCVHTVAGFPSASSTCGASSPMRSSPRGTSHCQPHHANEKP